MGLEETANMEDLAGDLAAIAALYKKLTTAMVLRSPEIVETVFAEIVDEDTFDPDCESLLAEVFSSEATTMGVQLATQILEFEHHIRAQYQDLF
jgi:hypothetical protein